MSVTRIRELRRSGGSAVVTVPPEMIEFTEFEEGQDVELTAEIGNDEIVVSAQTDS